MSSITLIEMIYLTERERIAADSFSRLTAALDDPRAVLSEVVSDRHVAQTLQHVDPTQIPDMPDRIIAATALYLGVPVISKDRRIRLSSVPTLW